MESRFALLGARMSYMPEGTRTKPVVIVGGGKAAGHRRGHFA
jgi:hypothetical protein